MLGSSVSPWSRLRIPCVHHHRLTAQQSDVDAALRLPTLRDQGVHFFSEIGMVPCRDDRVLRDPFHFDFPIAVEGGGPAVLPIRRRTPAPRAHHNSAMLAPSHER